MTIATSPRYFLKRIVSCTQNNEALFVGIRSSVDGMILVSNNNENRSILTRLATTGIEGPEIENNYLTRQLYQRNLLTAQPSPLPTAAINRNALFLDFLDTLSGPEERIAPLDVLFEKKVLILGCGAGGALQCYQLAQFGFRHITVVDFDSVAQSDVLRISLWNREDIGQKKVARLRSKIAENFGIHIEAIDHRCDEEFLAALLQAKDYDLILKAMDPSQGFTPALNRLATEHQVPYLSFAYSYDLVKVGPFVIPGETLDETLIEKAHNTLLGTNDASFHFEQVLGDYLIHPSVNFNIHLLAGLAFKEVLYFLLGKTDLLETIDNQLVYSSVTGELLHYNYRQLAELAGLLPQ